MLWYALILDQPVNFVVSYHAKLDDQVFSCSNARRDGSMVGSKGFEGPHDGGYDPLIVWKGKQIRFNDKTKIRDGIISDFAKNGNYLVSDGYSNKWFNTRLIKNELVVVGPAIKPKFKDEPAPLHVEPDPNMKRLFPVPSGVSDTASLKPVIWMKWSNGLRLAQIEISTDFDFSYRVALKSPEGKVRPLEDCVPGLKGYLARSIHHVENNWILVSAEKKPKDTSSLWLGNGSHLFWIEVR
jgi:hypothetical protein